MGALITRSRILRFGGFASTQVAVQLIGFASGILLVRCMSQVQYGYYTLAVSMAAIAHILSDLGLATAVLSQGGRLADAQRAALVSDANLLQRRLSWLSFAVMLPCFAFLLARQQAPAWQVAALTLLIIVSAVLHVRAGIALSVARLQGRIALQQKLDLGINVAKFALLSVASWIALDATIACIVNLGVAVAYWVVLRRYLAGQLPAPVDPAGTHLPALRAHVWKQAPNSVYFVFSGQIALWLIGVFGDAQRVAEVGALGRLGAMFAVVGAVSAALVHPYFARRDNVDEIRSAFVAVNLFYALLLLVLLAAATAFPSSILWILGNRYDGLHAELVWMIAASTLAAWGGMVYGIGCSRGWVMPIGLSMSTGLAATLAAAAAVDVSTVRGSFMINTATGLASTLTTLAYFAWHLRRHARLQAARP